MATRKAIDQALVVQTAIAVADEHGFESVTLASVADLLGIRIPSLYNHVAGLGGMRDAMTLWAVRQQIDRMRRAAVGKAGDEAVLALANAQRDFALEHPGLYSSTQRAATSDKPELAAAQNEVLDILLAVMAYYGYQADEGLHAVRAVRSMIHGFIDLETSGGFGLALDRDASFRRLVQILVAGLQR